MSSCCTRTHLQTATSALNLTCTIMHLQVRVTHAGELLKHASCLFRSSPSVSFSSACSVRVSLLLYLILPSWFLALDRGWSAMKSSPIATRLVYIYRTHRGTVKRRKSHMSSYTHSHTLSTTTHSPHTFRNDRDRKQAADKRESTLKLSGVIRRAAGADATEPYCSNFRYCLA